MTRQQQLLKRRTRLGSFVVYYSRQLLRLDDLASTEGVSTLKLNRARNGLERAIAAWWHDIERSKE